MGVIMTALLTRWTILIGNKVVGSTLASTYERALHEAKRRHKGQDVRIERAAQ